MKITNKVLVFVNLMIMSFHVMSIEKEYFEVSILSLITDPSEYQNKSLYIDGVIYFNGEQAYLYATKDYYESKIRSGRITLKLLTVPNALCLSKGQFVKVFGDFSVVQNSDGPTKYSLISNVSSVRILNSVIYPETHSDYGKGAIELFNKEKCRNKMSHP